MNNYTDNFIEKSLEALNKKAAPTQRQKESILKSVLIHANTDESASKILNIKNMTYIYPWRFALGASVVQAIIFTTLFGSNYTTLVFRFIGR